MISMTKISSGICRIVTLTSVDTVCTTDKTSTFGKLGSFYLRQRCSLCMVAKRGHGSHDSRMYRLGRYVSRVNREATPLQSKAQSTILLPSRNVGSQSAQNPSQRDVHQTKDLAPTETDGVCQKVVERVQSTAPEGTQPNQSKVSPQTPPSKAPPELLPGPSERTGKTNSETKAFDQRVELSSKGNIPSETVNAPNSKSTSNQKKSIASSSSKKKSKKKSAEVDKTDIKQKEGSSTKAKKAKTKSASPASHRKSSEGKAPTENHGKKDDGNQTSRQSGSSSGNLNKKTAASVKTQPHVKSKAKSGKKNQENKTSKQTISHHDGKLSGQSSAKTLHPALSQVVPPGTDPSPTIEKREHTHSIGSVADQSSAITNRTSAVSNDPQHASTSDKHTTPESSQTDKDVRLDRKQEASMDENILFTSTNKLTGTKSPQNKSSTQLQGAAEVGDGRTKPAKERRRWSTVDNPEAYLQPFMNVSIFCGMIEEAQMLFESARLHHQDLTTGHYNTMLQAWARKGNLNQVRALFAQMASSNLKPDLQSYAAALECMARIKDISHSVITKCLQQMESADLSPSDIFQNCAFANDQREVILKVLQDVCPGFEAPPPLQRPQCNIDIVKELYEDRSTPKQRDRSERSSHPGIMSKEEILSKLDEQMKMEKNETVLIPSVELETSNTHSRQAILDKHKMEWGRALTASFKFELQKLSKLNVLKRATVGKMNFFPFFSIMEPHEYVNLMLDSLHELANSTEGSMTVLLSRELGYRVQRKYLIRRKIKMGVADKVLKLYKAYVSQSLNVKALNHREMWKDIEDSMPEGPSLDSDVESWPSNITLGIGSRLAEMMIREIKINANMASTKKPVKMIPALYHMYTYRGFKQVGYIKPHPSLVEMLQYVKEIEMPFDSNLLPMISPPIPWSSVKFGAFPLSTTKIMRCKDGTPQHQSLLKKTKSAELYPILDSLNQLASTPWIINKPLLDVIVDVFRNGGSQELDVAQPPSAMQPIPKPSGETTQRDLTKIQQQRALLRKTQAEMHSLRMDALYKLSIANKYRDEIIWFPHNMDFRGRVYPCPPHFNHMGSDVTRSILMFAEGLPLGEKGVDWLKIHLVNLTGHKKRCSLAERLAYANEMLANIKDSAENPLEGEGWWKTADDQWQALACCMEIKNALQHTDPSSYVSHLPVHQDGSCNGLQHYAALARDVIGAQQVNLCPSDVPQDVYSGVAKMVEEICRRDAANDVPQAKLLTGHIQRKVVKQTVMTVVYGVTMYGGKWQIHKQLSEVPTDVRLYAAGYLARNVFQSLRKMFTKTREIQDWLTECAWLISKAGQTVEWVTPLGLPVVQPYHKKNLKVINHADHVMYHADRNNTDEQPNTTKQKNAFPPNFIHSLDSTHMMLTSLHCHNAGISYSSVHDCFWTHAASIDVMNKICREQFVRLHSEPILNNLADFMMEKYGDLTISPGSKVQKANPHLKVIGDFIQQVPEKGDFDLTNVLKSTFFFS